MNNVTEFKPGCLLTEAKPVYKRMRHRYRLSIGNVVFIGETPSQVKWNAYFSDLADKPTVSWFGSDLGGAA